MNYSNQNVNIGVNSDLLNTEEPENNTIILTVDTQEHMDWIKKLHDMSGGKLLLDDDGNELGMNYNQDGGGIFDFVVDAPRKIAASVSGVLGPLFDSMLSILGGTPLDRPIGGLRDILLGAIQRGEDAIKIVEVEYINDQPQYALNEDNPIMSLLADLVRAFLPFTKDMSFQEIALLFHPDSINETLVIIFGALLGYMCIIEQKIGDTFGSISRMFGGGSNSNDTNFVQEGGEVVTIAVIAIVASAVVISLAIVAIVVLVIALCLLIVLLVLIVGLIYIFHDAIIWAITYIGNITTTLILMIPVYIITLKSDDPEMLDKALIMMQNLPTEPYDTMDRMTDNYSRSMDSFDQITGLAYNATDNIADIGISGTGAITELGVSGAASISGIGGLYGGSNNENNTLCKIINDTKLLGTDKIQARDLVNALAELKASDFTGPSWILGQFFILIYILMYNYESIHSYIAEGSLFVPNWDWLKGATENATNATPEQIKYKAEYFGKLADEENKKRILKGESPKGLLGGSSSIAKGHIPYTDAEKVAIKLDLEERLRRERTGLVSQAGGHIRNLSSFIITGKKYKFVKRNEY